MFIKFCFHVFEVFEKILLALSSPLNLEGVQVRIHSIDMFQSCKNMYLSYYIQFNQYNR